MDWLRVIGASLALFVVATLLLGLSFRHFAHDTAARASNSPIVPFVPPSLKSSFPSKPHAQAVLGQLPLIFEPNQGQANSEVKFLAHGSGYALSLNASGAVLALQIKPDRRNASEELVRMRLVGANAHSKITGANPLPGKSNYIVGNDPRQWHTGVPQFGAVRYDNVYPGIDLVFYGNQGHLEYDFSVAPGADPARAQLQFDPGTRLELSDGNLIVSGKNGNGTVLRLLAPQIYQRDGDRRQPVEGRFVLLADNCVTFETGPYDRTRELIIDPALVFSSYFGAIGAGTSPSVAVNGDGFIYLTGSTSGTSTFPLSGTVPTTVGTPNVFVAKINPTSPPSVVYATFIGGNGTDTSAGLAVDQGGNAYVVGNTTSSNFPTTSLAYETAPTAKGSQCAATTCTSLFLSVVNPLGTALTYSSYISGNGDDVATAMAIDTSQEVLITGTTTSNNTPTSSVAFPATLLPVPLQTTALSSIQFFMTKVNTRIPGVGGIAYSTYFGGDVPGTPIAIGGGIAVDATGNVYISGTTNFYNSGSGLYGNYSQGSPSGDFPILNSYQPCLDTIPPLTLPSSNPCTPPTTTPYPTDAFVAKIDPIAPAGSQLLFSTYLGGTASDSSTAVAVDSANNVYITGSTNSTDFLFPTGTTTFQSCLNSPTSLAGACPATTTDTDAYVARFSIPSTSTTGVPNFVQLNYFSYFGGGGNDVGNSIAVDTANDALITGSTTSGTASPLPVSTGAIQTSLNGTQNAFFARINTATTTTNTVTSYVTYFGGNGVDSGTSIAVDPSLNTYFVGNTTSSNLQVADPLTGPGGATINGSPDAFVVKLATAADLCITCVAPVISPNGPTVSAGNPVSITFTVTNNGPDLATNVGVTGLVPTGAAFTSGSVQAGSGTCSTPSGTTIVCNIPTLQAGSSANIVLNVTASNPGTYAVTATVSSTNNTNTNSTGTASFTATGFTVAIAPSSQTVAAGQGAQYSVIVAPTQGVFNANVSLTCSALPTGASCNFTTSTLSLSSGAGSASTILNLLTTAQPVNTASTSWHGRFYALWLTVPGLSFLGLGTRRKRSRTWLVGLFALIALFATTLLLPACSGSKTQPTVSGTPSGTYPLTVTATSGSLTKTAPFTLTVIP